MMLRDEAEVALNDLIGLAITAAETYETSARVVAEHDAALAAMFEDIAGERRRMATDLRALDRRLGDLPHAVDPDYTTLHDLFVSLKGMFASDERRAVIDECESADNALAARVVSALTLPLPETVTTALRQLQYDVTATLGRLAAVRARL